MLKKIIYLFGGSILTAGMLHSVESASSNAVPMDEFPLFSACERGDVSAVRNLCQGGADVNAKGEDDMTALHHAFVIKDGLDTERIIEILLNHGANVNIQAENGMTALHYALAIECGLDAEKVIEILLNHGADIHAQDIYGEPPLIDAVRSHNVNAVKILCKRGANVNAKGEYDKTALHFASGIKDGLGAEIIEILLNHGANIHARDVDGMTPLIPAVCSHNVNAVKILCKRGANVNAKDNTGTALHYASAIKGDLRAGIIKILLNHGADMNARDINKITPLMQAVLFKDANAVEIFCKHGADVNVKDKHDRTALHYVDMNPDVNANKMIEILLNHGADIHVTDYTGKQLLRYSKAKVDRI